MATVEVAVLGPLELRIDGVVVRLPGRRPAALLATLALARGHTVSVEELARSLWGETLPQRVKGSLQTYVGRLRRVMGDGAIVTGMAGYRIDLQLVDVDLDQYLMLVGRAEAQPDRAAVFLDDALSLWRGEPLNGLSEWLEHNERPALIERHLATVEHRLDLWLAAGDFDEAIVRLRPLVDQHPLRESLWERLLTALRHAGRSAEALAQYEVLRSLLADELGADPSPSVQVLHRDLLAAPTGAGRSDSHSDSRAIPHQLPWVVNGFVGRENQLARLDRLVDSTGRHNESASPRGQVVAIHGPAGSGKTTLAVQWASRSAEAYPDGELFVRLNGYGSSAPLPATAALESMLRAIGVGGADIPADVEDRSAMFRTRMAERRMIVVIDDAHDVGQLRPLLPGGESVVIITSRSQLRGLAAREGAARVAVGPMTEEESVSLLAVRLDDTGGPGHADAGVETANLTELATLCGHLPVAMVVAAERVIRGDVTFSGLVANLRGSRGRLAALATGDDALADVAAVFDWSYRSLPPKAAVLYRHLGALVDKVFDVPVAAALLGEELDGAARALDQLVERHLLTVIEPGRYVVHDLVREHAYGVAASAPRVIELEATATRLREWYVHSAFAAASTDRDRTVYRPDPPPEGVDPEAIMNQKEAMAWFEWHRRAIETVIAQATATGDHGTACRLAMSTTWYYARIGAFDEQALLVEVALVSARAAADDVATAVLLNTKGSNHGRQGQHDEARAALLEARELFVRSGYPIGEYRVVSNLGQLHIIQGEPELAVDLFEEASAVTADFDEAERVRVGNLLALAYLAAGRLDDAAHLSRRMADRCRMLGDADGEATALDHLGAIGLRRGCLDEAEAAYRAAAALYSALGDEYETAWTLAELGYGQAEAGLIAKARDSFTETLTILDRIGASDSAELNRADIEVALNRLRGAEEAAT